MIGVRRTRAGLAAVLVLAAAAGAQEGQASSAQRALLVRGAASVRGLPFFPPNALTALAGAYSLAAPAATGSAAPSEAAVWYTREALVLGGEWKKTDLGGTSAFTLARPTGRLLVVKTPRYYLFFELPQRGGQGTADPRDLAFVRAFDRKFQVFFENAATDAELSFPAYVDY